jgi:hypothetical protein
MKRFYIAVGSTALNALMNLVYRYREYGLLLDNQGTGEDYFIAIDSNEQKILQFQELSENHEWLLGLTMFADPQLLELTRSAVHPNWPEHEHYAGGVGGIRRASLRTLNVFRSWNNAGQEQTNQHASFLRILNQIESDSLVVLVGSAFGGTSSGSYWNLAVWLRRYLNHRFGANDGGPRQSGFKRFYGFSIFPDPAQWDSGYEQLASNVCNFLRDMEQLRIENWIMTQESGTFEFRPVSLAQARDIRCGRESKFVFGLAGTDRHGAQAVDASRGSFLPMESLFLVSTQQISANGGPTEQSDSKDVSRLVAEELFLFGKFDIVGMTGDDALFATLVDRAPRCVEGMINAEGFSEIHFISGRTKLRGVMSEHIRGVVLERFNDFSNMDLGLSQVKDAWNAVVIKMAANYTSRQETGLKETAIRELVVAVLNGEDHDASKWRVMAEALKNAVRIKATTYPYARKPDFLAKIFELYTPRDEDLAQDGKLPFTMARVEDLYKTMFEPIFTLKERSQAELVVLDDRISAFPQALRDEFKRRMQLPIWVGVGGRKTYENVARELEAEGMVLLEDLLQAYRHVLRCEATAEDRSDAFAQIAACFRKDNWEGGAIDPCTLHCIAEPAIPQTDRDQFTRDFQTRKTVFYPQEQFLKDARKILELWRTPVDGVTVQDRFNLARHVLDRVDASRNSVIESGTPSGDALRAPLFDGIDGVSGAGRPPEIVRDSQWNNTHPILFTVDGEPGEKKKSGSREGDALQTVPFGEIARYGDWGTQFCPVAGANHAAAFDTRKPLQNEGRHRRINPNQNASENGRMVRIDDFWMGDFQYDTSIQRFLEVNYGGLQLANTRQVLFDQEQNAHRRTIADYYSRLLRFSEAVQFGLVFGCISHLIKACEGNVWRVTADRLTCGMPPCDIPASCYADGQLTAATAEMFTWARDFIKAEAIQSVFADQEHGAKEFFGDLDELEKSALIFRHSDSNYFRLDYRLDSTGEGKRSAATLRWMFEELCKRIKVETAG